MPWKTLILEPCEDWLDKLPLPDKESILENMVVLEQCGPSLGRPYVDHIEGSRHPNMKELRARHRGHQYRVLFAFDPNRRAVFLIGDDKTGKDDRLFYKAIIKRADDIYDQHLNHMERLTP